MILITFFFFPAGVAKKNLAVTEMKLLLIQLSSIGKSISFSINVNRHMYVLFMYYHRHNKPMSL